MTRGSAKAELTLAAFLLGLFLLNPPLLSIFSRDASLFGLPLLFVYLFSAWGLMILLMALATGRDPEAGKSGAPRLRAPRLPRRGRRGPPEAG